LEEKTSVNPQRPLLIIGDAPSAPTGLGRITAEVASRAHQHLGDAYRVAALGYGGPGSRRFGFQPYVIEGLTDWVIPTLPEVWQDFAGNEKGIVLAIWDPSRLTWFSRPETELLKEREALRRWLFNAPFERWLYCPLDATGPDGKLSFPLKQTLLGFDRILAYGQWGQGVIEQTLGQDESAKRHLDSLPHGIDTEVFFESDRQLCRRLFARITGAQTMTGACSPIAGDEILIGIVATNQARKDWALGIETAAILGKDRKVRLWIHTDKAEHHWSIPALLIDYGLVDRALISLGYLSDEKMAEAYSACDATLGIGAGEGWGFPLAESLACGTPVIHGNYAGGRDIVPPEMRVEPVAYRMEGLYSSVRPVFQAQDWATRVLQFIGKRATLDPQFAWSNLWPRWQKWLLDGMGGGSFRQS